MKSSSTERYRKSIRLKGYDYSQSGAYFVTICTHNRECTLGDVADERMALSKFGKIVEEEWFRTAYVRPEVSLDAFVVMPNHVHGIIVIDSNGTGNIMPTVGAHSRAPLQRQARSLGSLIAGFKSIVTKRINTVRETPGASVWQRNYYEHIIRNEEDLNRIREYIVYNPALWDKDENNPINL